MTGTPRPSTTLIPPLPDGWHVVSYSVLADGELAVLGADADLTAEWRRDANGMVAGDPWGIAERAQARVWRLADDTLMEGPTFPLLTAFPMLERFPDGRWLVAGRRAADIGNARVMTPDGTELRRIHLGDGIAHLKIDEAALIWVGWFDEGVFGNESWRVPGHDWPPSSDGLAAFDEFGVRVAWASPPAGVSAIADCYALNVVDRTAFACTYTDFPIVSISAGKQTWSRTRLSGPGALAVELPYVLALGGYGEQRNRAVLLRLDSHQSAKVREWRLSITSDSEDRLEFLDGRGDTLHAICGSKWSRWSIKDFLAAAGIEKSGQPPPA